MFVSEIIPGLWVCDYDVIRTAYFDTRNIQLFIHIYTYGDEKQVQPHTRSHNQSHINIRVQDIIMTRNNDTGANNKHIARQNAHHAEQYGDSILNTIELVNEVLTKLKGVVIYSKYGIQKAATYACAYLIMMGSLQTTSAINIMLSKEPLCFKDPRSTDRNEHIIMYRDALKYIEYNS